MVQYVCTSWGMERVHIPPPSNMLCPRACKRNKTNGVGKCMVSVPCNYHSMHTMCMQMCKSAPYHEVHHTHSLVSFT